MDINLQFKELLKQLYDLRYSMERRFVAGKPVLMLFDQSGTCEITFKTYTGVMLYIEDKIKALH